MNRGVRKIPLLSSRSLTTPYLREVWTSLKVSPRCSSIGRCDYAVDESLARFQLRKIIAWMKTILFVCTGNICRSPMAEGLFRQAVKGPTDFRVLSAGVGAADGMPPSEYAVQALKELGIDISRQRSRVLTAELVQQADYIFGMTHSHVDAV